MKRRDIGVLGLGLLAVAIQLRKDGSASFRTVWYTPIERHDSAILNAGRSGDGLGHRKSRGDEGGKPEGMEEALPQPVVADLNGDGRPEALIANSVSTLRIVESTSIKSGNTIRDARVLHEISLLPSAVRVAAGRRPVAMAAGYLDAPLKEDKSGTLLRKQVIVVLTASWHVLCFDHNLLLLWESSLQHEFPGHTLQREVAILITNHSMLADDRGTVIVGGSMEIEQMTLRETDAIDEEYEIEKEEEAHMTSGSGKDTLKRARSGETFHDGSDSHKKEKSKHFSYFAMNGKDGSVRWHHKSMDFHRDPSALSMELIPQHFYKLDAKALEGKHQGEVSCRKYRESLMQILPHRWITNHDTRMSLAHFRKHDRSHLKSESKFHKTKARDHLSGRESGNSVAESLQQLGSVMDATRPTESLALRNRKDDPPNVIISYVKEGIEVLHLYTGRTLCKLYMPDDELHVDLNADGVIDHVKAFGGDAKTTHLHKSGHQSAACTALVTSGFPVQEPLFNASICKVYGRIGELSLSSSRNPSRALSKLPTQVATPVSLLHEKYHKKPSLDGDIRHKRDLIFFNSRGDIISYSSTGSKRWSVAVAVGDNVLTSVTVSGSKMPALNLPESPVAPVQITDFNGDGYNDLILHTYHGYYGLEQVVHPGAVLLSLLLGCMIIVIVGIMIVQEVEQQQESRVNSRR